MHPEQYYERIGLEYRDNSVNLETLRLLHQRHMRMVPFENLSIHYQQPILLQEALLYEKIVLKQRGGFCYELNGAFQWLLRTLGFRVSMLAADVWMGERYGPSFDHMTLLVRDLDGENWLVDVGFGASFEQPLRLVVGLEQDGGDGKYYRLRQEQDLYILEQRSGVDWVPQYRFALTPYPLSAFDEMCLYQQTSPDSHFTQKRICSLATLDGRISLSDLKLITTVNGQREERLLASESEVLTTLKELFGVVL